MNTLDFASDVNQPLPPAVILAGPPNCGKSVLGYLLTCRLTEARLPHYLLRAVPDGEGNWFFGEAAADLRLLRSQLKTGHTPEFRRHMQAVIQGRLAPLLVDMGGKPTPADRDLIRTCTHFILLYREAAERATWLAHLAGLTGLAELQSTLTGSDQVLEIEPVLRGTITALERDPQQRRSGAALQALVEKLRALFVIGGDAGRQMHLAGAPYPVLEETGLWAGLPGHDPAGRVWWQPQDLLALQPALPPGPSAIYGRGPVWLAAFLAAACLPCPAAIFDLRFGWIDLTTLALAAGVRQSSPGGVQFDWRRPAGGQERVEIQIPGGALELEDFSTPHLEPDLESGLVLSGKLPRWVYAALVRNWSGRRAWLAVWVPPLNGAVVVHSLRPDTPVGQVVSIPAG